ncbi:HAD-IIIC family phosphatase [Plantactinospora sp. S1510]|uniref:HAD-IIIC family phosphatase n=1 Tax=Plantactinospora alkalitolerans TaxID=2789879 RepID=A0ABS0H460_9ACTN|nr:HAD-IIIC family phosphatase [Plantactinospora alkalitolerans]MBF9133252.1 HAD-IIIC family phosphatase [Plantactinospora alkalitolerans]
MTSLQIRVAANFTAGPLAEPLEFVLAEAGLAADVTLAPYGEVFQSLLDPDGALRGNTDGANVVLLRRDGWLTGGPAAVEQIAHDLVRAIVDCAAASGVPHLVVSCPADDPTDAIATAFERRLVDGLADDARIAVASEAEILRQYPVPDIHDHFALATADVPYTPEMYAGLALTVVRAVHAWRVPRPKVIVVDADHTLWDGAVGEDGPLGVRVGPAHREIQRLLLAQRDAGRLICMASKNAEADVLETLRRHPDMLLRAEHLSGWRINWAPKSANIAELAAELTLGLDSFVFIDDSPVEAAEVRAAHPAVLTLSPPSSGDGMLSYLRHCWPLDHPRVTDDDRARAERYREERRRETARSTAPSLAEFLASLDLVVTVEPMDGADAARVAQLTQRVNQFNLAGTRRSVSELIDLPPGAECLVVRARDRFGDYGLAGAVQAVADGSTYRVDGLWLSCRVLGRGVEHRVLRALGARAVERGLGTVSLPYRPAERNQPAIDFLRNLPAGQRTGPEGTEFFDVPAGVASTETFQPDGGRPTAAPAPGAVATTAGVVDNATVDRIARSLADPTQVLETMAARRSAPPLAELVTADATQAIVAKIWAELLEFPPRTVDDNFYELGGHSLLVVQFAGRVRDEFDVELPVDVLFTDRFTVADMARAINERRAAPGDDVLIGMLAKLDELSDDEVRRLLDADR